jgi:hypothetical protein
VLESFDPRESKAAITYGRFTYGRFLKNLGRFLENAKWASVQSRHDIEPPVSGAGNMDVVA